MNKIDAQPMHSRHVGGDSNGKKNRGGFSRTDVRYWRSRVQKVVCRDGTDSPNYSAHISYRGRRMRFPLETPNLDTAAEKARKIYVSLMANGWDVTLAQFKPKTVLAGDLTTVGEWLTAVGKHCGLFTNTLQVYASALRKLSGDVAGIKQSESRYDHKSGGNTVWREAVDKVKLSRITAGALNEWRNTYLKSKIKTPEAQRRAMNSARAHVRNAKALFGKKVVKTLRVAGLALPPEIPFADVSLPELCGKRLSARYVSKVDATALLQAASLELSVTKPDAFKSLLLGLLCGLRRREIDTLQWEQIDFTTGVLRIEHTSYVRLKSEDSAGEIELDAEFLACLKEWKEASKGRFVVQSATPAKDFRSRTSYRCETTFTTLMAWLRSKGVASEKPLHTMRKEAGNLITASSGIFAASRFLRHSDIRITSETYADKPARITTGLSGLLPTPINVININKLENHAEKRKGKRITKRHACA